MSKKAFTMIELMVVILIIGVLAGASVPLMRGRIETSKWAEAKAAVGTIRSAVRVRFAETGTADGLIGPLSSNARRTALGFGQSDLVGTYFVPGDYRIIEVNSEGIATIRVTGSQDNAPSGSMTLDAEGNWTFSRSSAAGAGSGNSQTGANDGNTGGDNTGSGDTGGSDAGGDDTGGGDTGGGDTGGGDTGGSDEAGGGPPFVPPGQGGSPPGQGGPPFVPPGHGGTPPGQGGTPPGRPFR